MKALSAIVLTALVSSSASALDGRLASLDCLASNGVEVKTKEETLLGLTVVSKWGFVTKSFTAKVGITGYDANSTIELVNEKNEIEYLLSLNLKPEVTEKQNATGYILLPARFAGAVPAPVAGVVCEIQIQK